MPQKRVPHPRFPVGCKVEVIDPGPMSRMRKESRRLIGRVGKVEKSARLELMVSFPGERFRYFFAPGLLKPAA